MKLRGKKETEEDEIQPKEVEKEVEEKGTKKKKKQEAEGSRWAALILLILTIVAGLWFYIQGAGGWQKLEAAIGGIFSGWGGESRYSYEKAN